MDLSLLIGEVVSLFAASTWITLGIGLGLSLLLVIGAPRLSISTDESMKLPRAWRLRGLGVGLACGTLFGSLFVWGVGADHGSPATVFIVLPAVATALAGRAVAGAIAGATGGERIDRRVGHSQAVSLRDYVSSPVLWAARILVLTATIALVLLYVLPLRRTPDGSPLANPLMSAFAVVPALFVLVLIEVGARILVSRASSAESADALRRQDLRRVRIARDGSGAGLSLAVLAFVFSVPQLIADIDPYAGFLAMTNPGMPILVEFAAVICVAIAVAILFRAEMSSPPEIPRSTKLSKASR